MDAAYREIMAKDYALQFLRAQKEIEDAERKSRTDRIALLVQDLNFEMENEAGYRQRMRSASEIKQEPQRTEFEATERQRRGERVARLLEDLEFQIRLEAASRPEDSSSEILHSSCKLLTNENSLYCRNL